MMKKLICKLFGHQWLIGYIHGESHVFYGKDIAHCRCTRCGLVRTRLIDSNR